MKGRAPASSFKKKKKLFLAEGFHPMAGGGGLYVGRG